MYKYTARGINSPSVSYYYQYNHVSPDDIYAEIKQEMRSYFNTGVLNDTMFPIYTDKALRKLGRSTFKIGEDVIKLADYQGKLPPDFKFVRELWACSNVTEVLKNPSSTYSQETCVVSPYGDYDRCNPCDTCPEDCNTSQFIYYKTNEYYTFTFSKSHLLKPGNISVRNQCAGDCANFGSDSWDTFEIRDNKVVTNFQDGHLYLVYYKEELDESQNQLIPDNFYIQEYIKSFIKWKMYEQLYNEVTDETFNQIERKYMLYKQEYNDAFIMADAEVKKQTVYQKNLSIKRMRNRLDRYIIR